MKTLSIARDFLDGVFGKGRKQSRNCEKYRKDKRDRHKPFSQQCPICKKIVYKHKRSYQAHVKKSHGALSEMFLLT